uniref:(northern house mosquito) hypothetical protein n=1 Tax=Culex pipiens TaxID=7175 RepID=A0A8D8N2V2_CULPI
MGPSNKPPDKKPATARRTPWNTRTPRSPEPTRSSSSMTPRRTKSRSNSAVQRPCSLGSKSKSSAHSSDSTESKFCGPRWPTRVVGSPVRGEPKDLTRMQFFEVSARDAVNMVYVWFLKRSYEIIIFPYIIIFPNDFFVSIH